MEPAVTLRNYSRFWSSTTCTQPWPRMLTFGSYTLAQTMRERLSGTSNHRLKSMTTQLL